MRCLSFQLGLQRYALPLRDIVEVLPMLNVRTLAQAPLYIRGLISYRGQTVPLLDLCQLALGRHCELRMSTRLLIVRIGRATAGTQKLLGVLVESAVDALEFQDADFSPSPVRVDQTPYLTGLATQASGLIQRVDVSMLLSDEVVDLLYPEEAAAP